MTRLVLLLSLSSLIACGASGAHSHPESRPEPRPQPGPAVEAEPDDEDAWRLAADDDAVATWNATGTHAEGAEALQRAWRGALALATDDTDHRRVVRAAVDALDAAARVARDPANHAEGENPPSVHSTLEHLYESLRRDDDPLPPASLEGSGAGNSWIVHGVLASHTVREIVPIVVPELASVARSLQDFGSPYEHEARYLAAIDRLIPLAVASGAPPRRQFAEEDVPYVLWWTLEAVHLALFASERDIGMVPDTTPGWCRYARWLAYEHWTEIDETVYWSGEEIDTQLMALEETAIIEMEEDDEMPPPTELSAEQLREIRSAWEQLERLTYEQRRLTLAGTPAEIRAGLDRILPRLDVLTPVLTSTYDPLAIRQIADRRASTIALRCER